MHERFLRYVPIAFSVLNFLTTTSSVFFAFFHLLVILFCLSFCFVKFVQIVRNCASRRRNLFMICFADWQKMQTHFYVWGYTFDLLQCVLFFSYCFLYDVCVCGWYFDNFFIVLFYCWFHLKFSLDHRVSFSVRHTRVSILNFSFMIWSYFYISFSWTVFFIILPSFYTIEHS